MAVPVFSSLFRSPGASGSDEKAVTPRGVTAFRCFSRKPEPLRAAPLLFRAPARWPWGCLLYTSSSGIRLSEAAYRLLYRDGTFFGIRISITTTYLRRGKQAFFLVFSRENRRIRFDIIPAGCYRNLFATCRVKSGIPMSGERPRRSGSDAPARFGSGCGFRPEGEGEAVIRAQTGAWPFLEIGGFLQKNGNYRSKQGCTTRNGRTYAAWRLLNAQRWNPTCLLYTSRCV